MMERCGLYVQSSSNGLTLEKKPFFLLLVDTALSVL